MGIIDGFISTAVGVGAAFITYDYFINPRCNKWLFITDIIEGIATGQNPCTPLGATGKPTTGEKSGTKETNKVSDSVKNANKLAGEAVDPNKTKIFDDAKTALETFLRNIKVLLDPTISPDDKADILGGGSSPYIPPVPPTTPSSGTKTTTKKTNTQPVSPIGDWIFNPINDLGDEAPKVLPKTKVVTYTAESVVIGAVKATLQAKIAAYPIQNQIQLAISLPSMSLLMGYILQPNHPRNQQYEREIYNNLINAISNLKSGNSTRAASYINGAADLLFWKYGVITPSTKKVGEPENSNVTALKEFNAVYGKLVNRLVSELGNRLKPFIEIISKPLIPNSPIKTPFGEIPKIQLNPLEPRLLV